MAAWPGRDWPGLARRPKQNSGCACPSDHLMALPMPPPQHPQPHPTPPHLPGKYLEAAAKGRTSSAISELLKLAPATAILCIADEQARSGWRGCLPACWPCPASPRGQPGSPAAGQQQASSCARSDTPAVATGPLPSQGRAVSEQEVPVSLLQRKDRLKVLPGARLPADGTVAEGRSFVDESMITGESVPVTKRPGDTVISGEAPGKDGCVYVWRVCVVWCCVCVCVCVCRGQCAGRRPLPTRPAAARPPPHLQAR